LVPMLSIVLFTAFTDFIYLIIGYLNEEKRKKKLKKAFGHYVSPKLVEEIAKDESRLELGGTKRSMSVMFTDFRDFTSLAEKLEPSQLSKLLSVALGRLTEIIYKYDGTVDKYIGDAIMAFWGAPLECEDHELKAVSCAVEMIEELGKLNKEVLLP